MKKVLEYIKLVVFVLGVLVGVQVPGFVDQYGKNLAARVSESGDSIAEFQDDADKYFGGDINRLVAHYNQKNDPVIVAGGESIDALVQRNQLLLEAHADFSHSLYRAYTHVLLRPLAKVRVEVWQNYTYNVVLNGSAIAIGLATGLALLISFDVFLFLIALPLRSIRKSRRASIDGGPVS